MKIKVGTRGSKLALSQTNFVAAGLKKAAPEIDIEVCVIKTKGDIMQDVSLLQIGGQGVFVKEIEEALLSGSIDLAVHSMKDVPGEIPEDLIFPAILQREDVRDVLVTRGRVKFEFLPKGAKIGTGSQRRGAQIKSFMPDVEIVPLRGNIDTRLKKIETENLTGVVLAAAGLKRWGTGKHHPVSADGNHAARRGAGRPGSAGEKKRCVAGGALHAAQPQDDRGGSDGGARLSAGAGRRLPPADCRIRSYGRPAPDAGRPAGLAQRRRSAARQGLGRAGRGRSSGPAAGGHDPGKRRPAPAGVDELLIPC
jgi:hypothetical protein